jgi:uncharacterized membrane protein
MKWYLVVGLTVLVMVVTLLVRIPVPGGGYFNMGDVLIVFSGLFAGWKTGLIAGGVGSPLADLIGFPVFAPLTLVIKGLEGLICGLAKPGNRLQSFIFPNLFGSYLLMLAGNFTGTGFSESGQSRCLGGFACKTDQASVGYIGGRTLYGAYLRITSN